MMRFLLIFHAVLVTISFGFIWLLAGHPQAWQFLSGAAIACLSLVFAMLLTKLILGKKSVALSVGLIVLKYPILGMFLLVAAVLTHWNLNWISVGLMTTIITGWATGFYFHHQQSQTPD